MPIYTATQTHAQIVATQTKCPGDRCPGHKPSPTPVRVESPPGHQMTCHQTLVKPPRANSVTSVSTAWRGQSRHLLLLQFGDFSLPSSACRHVGPRSGAGGAQRGRTPVRTATSTKFLLRFREQAHKESKTLHPRRSRQHVGRNLILCLSVCKWKYPIIFVCLIEWVGFYFVKWLYEFSALCLFWYRVGSRANRASSSC
jgi:hypothetical protein